MQLEYTHLFEYVYCKKNLCVIINLVSDEIPLKVRGELYFFSPGKSLHKGEHVIDVEICGRFEYQMNVHENVYRRGLKKKEKLLPRKKLFEMSCKLFQFVFSSFRSDYIYIYIYITCIFNI